MDCYSENRSGWPSSFLKLLGAMDVCWLAQNGGPAGGNPGPASRLMNVNEDQPTVQVLIVRQSAALYGSLRQPMTLKTLRQLNCHNILQLPAAQAQKSGRVSV